VICPARASFDFAQSVAAGGLMERTVTFGALAHDDVAVPILWGTPSGSGLAKRRITTGAGACANGWDIVPAIIDIRDQQIIVTYPDTVAGIVSGRWNSTAMCWIPDRLRAV
jgi:hypothetical protein